MTFDDDDHRALNREKRRRRDLERLGGPNPHCFDCAIDDPAVLELHHFDGQEFSGVIRILCRNCHKRRSDLQKDHPPKLANPADPLELHGRFDESLADELEKIVTRLREFGPMLCAEAAARSPRCKTKVSNDGADDKGG